MTNDANKKILANCLLLNRQRPIAYLEDVSPLNAVDVRWFSAPTYAQPVLPLPSTENVDIESPRAVKPKRRISLGRGPSLRLKTFFAAPSPHNRRGISDITIHAMVSKEDGVVNETIEVEKDKGHRTPIEGKFFDELSTEDRFWLRNSTTHIYQQQSSVKDNWLIRKLSIPKRQFPSLPISRIRQLSLKRRTETVLAN